MKIKALITDYDNTLADSLTGVTTEVAAAIRAALAKGYHVSIASGKPFGGVLRETCRSLGLTGLQIVHGGAEIVEAGSGKVRWARYIDDEVAGDLIRYLQAEQIYFAVEQGDAIYAGYPLPESLYGPGATLKGLSELHIHNVAKIVVSAVLNKFGEAGADELLNRLSLRYGQLHFVKGGYKGFFGLDITDLGATKHMAVLELMKLSGLDPGEVVAVGDGYNDYPLLTAAGHKVAMGDAPMVLKEIADLVVGTQADNGLIQAIDKYLV